MALYNTESVWASTLAVHASKQSTLEELRKAHARQSSWRCHTKKLPRFLHMNIQHSCCYCFILNFGISRGISKNLGHPLITLQIGMDFVEQQLNACEDLSQEHRLYLSHPPKCTHYILASNGKGHSIYWFFQQ